MLPDKLSDLIEVALNDLELVEKDPRYKIRMDKWHSPQVDGKCHVCMAGAVMAMTLQQPVGRMMIPTHFDYLNVGRKLHALDLARAGYFANALRELEHGDAVVEGTIKTEGIDARVAPVYAKIGRMPCEYEHAPDRFKAYLRGAVIELRENGL